MKLLFLCLALVSSALTKPIDDIMSLSSPDQPFALPAIDAKSAAQPAETVAAQPESVDANSQVFKDVNVADTTKPVEDAEPEKKSENNIPLNPDISNISKTTSRRTEVPAGPEIPLSEEESHINNQETKREIEPQAVPKTVETDLNANQPSEIAQPQNQMKNIPAGVIGVADATSNLAAVAEESIPPALKPDSVPMPEKKIDIIPEPDVPQSEPSLLESNEKSEESETLGKREVELKSVTDLKDNQPKIESPVVVEESKPEDEKKDEDKSVTPINVSPTTYNVASTKNEADVGFVNPTNSDSPIISSITDPAAKIAPAAATPIENAPGFVEEGMRVVRDTIEENKDEKDNTKVDISSPAVIADHSILPEEAISSKTLDISKKQESNESNESKDEESAASHRANNSSAEDSSEEKEKDEKKQDSVSADTVPAPSIVVAEAGNSVPALTKDVKKSEEAEKPVEGSALASS